MKKVEEFIRQSHDAESFSREDLVQMLSYPPDSPESYRLMAEARRISREVTDNRAEVHAQFSLNLAPCPQNCKWCSFAAVNKVFRGNTRLTAEDAVASARKLEEEGASAVYIMTTAHYDFGELMETAEEIRRNLRPKTPLVGNVGDRTEKEAQRMKDAGFTGVYHSLRFREGRDSAIDPKQRFQSFRAFQAAGLSIGTCVEPIGPEHGNEEIADLILFTGSLDPAYSGAARRISIPGTELAVKHGMISELRMAQCVAVTRIGLPRSVRGNCTHEPCTLGAAAGANLFWAEIGANPRDVKEKTEEGRGFPVSRCREIFLDAECGLLEGPSQYYTKVTRTDFGIPRDLVV